MPQFVVHQRQHLAARGVPIVACPLSPDPAHLRRQARDRGTFRSLEERSFIRGWMKAAWDTPAGAPTWERRDAVTLAATLTEGTMRSILAALLVGAVGVLAGCQDAASPLSPGDAPVALVPSWSS